jgi:hypothetical protein
MCLRSFRLSHPLFASANHFTFIKVNQMESPMYDIVVDLRPVERLKLLQICHSNPVLNNRLRRPAQHFRRSTINRSHHQHQRYLHRQPRLHLSRQTLLLLVPRPPRLWTRLQVPLLELLQARHPLPVSPHNQAQHLQPRLLSSCLSLCSIPLHI